MCGLEFETQLTKQKYNKESGSLPGKENAAGGRPGSDTYRPVGAEESFSGARDGRDGGGRRGNRGLSVIAPWGFHLGALQQPRHILWGYREEVVRLSAGRKTSRGPDLDS